MVVRDGRDPGFLDQRHVVDAGFSGFGAQDGDVRGATGKLGTAVHEELVARKHDVVTVSRNGGDLQYDVTDPAQVADLHKTVGQHEAGAAG